MLPPHTETQEHVQSPSQAHGFSNPESFEWLLIHHFEHKTDDKRRLLPHNDKYLVQPDEANLI